MLSASAFVPTHYSSQRAKLGSAPQQPGHQSNHTGFQPNPSNPFEHQSPHINPIAMASSRPTVPQHVYPSLIPILTKMKNKITLRILPKSTLTLLSLTPELLQELAHFRPPTPSRVRHLAEPHLQSHILQLALRSACRTAASRPRGWVPVLENRGEGS